MDEPCIGMFATIFPAHPPALQPRRGMRGCTDRLAASGRWRGATLSVSRSACVRPALHQRLRHARTLRAVVCCGPTAIKSLVLRFVELLHTAGPGACRPGVGGTLGKPPVGGGGVWLPFQP